MKKIALMIIVATIMLGSCSKDNLTTDNIVGTKWKSEVYDGNLSMDILFSNKSAATFTLYENGKEREYFVMAYSLEYPNISFFNDGEILGTGLFTNNTTFKLKEDPRDDDYFTTFHKQK